MHYKIQWDIRAYKELKHLDNKDAIRILNVIDELFENPQNAGEPLEGKFKGKHRIRIGDYRVIYCIIVIPMGLGILATEFIWSGRLLKGLKNKFKIKRRKHDG